MIGNTSLGCDCTNRDMYNIFYSSDGASASSAVNCMLLLTFFAVNSDDDRSHQTIIHNS